MNTTLYRLGTRVRTHDRGAKIHGRLPDKPEAIGTIRDYYRPHGKHSKEKTPPYFVEFDDGATAWYDADEVERVASKEKQECGGTGAEVSYGWQECSKEYVECAYCGKEQKLTEAQLRKGAGHVLIRRHTPPRVR